MHNMILTAYNICFWYILGINSCILIYNTEDSKIMKNFITNSSNELWQLANHIDASLSTTISDTSNHAQTIPHLL